MPPPQGGGAAALPNFGVPFYSCVRRRGFDGRGEIGVATRNYLLNVGNAAEVSGLSAAILSLTISGMSGLVVPEPPSQIADMET